MAKVSTRMDFSRYPRRTIPRDEALFLEEEDSHELYILLTGSFGVFRDEIQVALIDEPLSLVGEISALTKRPRNATVRALQYSTVVVVADPDKLFEEYPQLGSKTARLLAQRLAAMNRRFVELKRLVARKGREAVDRGLETQPSWHRETVRLTADVADVKRRTSRPARAPVAAPPPSLTAVPEDARYVDDVMDALEGILDWGPEVDSAT